MSSTGAEYSEYFLFVSTQSQNNQKLSPQDLDLVIHKGFYVITSLFLCNTDYFSISVSLRKCLLHISVSPYFTYLTRHPSVLNLKLSLTDMTCFGKHFKPYQVKALSATLDKRNICIHNSVKKYLFTPPARK